MLHLVRHGRPLVDHAVSAHEWRLDPAGYDEVWALRDSGRLPRGATWFSSPEPKALETAQLLTDGEVSVVEGLRELRRDSTQWHDDHAEVVRRAFADPQTSGGRGMGAAGRLPGPRGHRGVGDPRRPPGRDRWCWSATARRGRCWSRS